MSLPSAASTFDRVSIPGGARASAATLSIRRETASVQGRTRVARATPVTEIEAIITTTVAGSSPIVGSRRPRQTPVVALCAIAVQGARLPQALAGAFLPTEASGPTP
jgi:hypothetical protein